MSAVRAIPHRSRTARLLLPAALVALGAAAVAAQMLGKRESRDLPTTRVTRGNLDLTVYTRGELRPLRSGLLIAPPVRGQLQITHLVKTGERVKAGDVVFEFDPSEQEYNIDLARSELNQAEQEIAKSKADAVVQASQDEVTLLAARFEVRRAELEVSRNELVSQIEAKKNHLALQEAKRKQTQVEGDVKARQVTARASVAVLEQKRNRQKIHLDRAESDLKTLKVTAPFDGLVYVKDNQDVAGGFFIDGMVLPEYRQGDLVFPGRTIAEVLDISQMEVQAKVSEMDRSRITVGQKVDVSVDARPDQKFKGTVKDVAGQASRGMFWESTGSDRKFDVTFVLDLASLAVRPGVTCDVRIAGEDVKNALLLPRQAIFEKDGKPVVYVKRGQVFDALVIRVLHRSESRVAVEGIAEGTEVSLADPTKSGPAKPGKTSGPVMTGGGI
jgi:multidrug efflux pump subunit AcrA (membrane-fusion protein)